MPEIDGAVENVQGSNSSETDAPWESCLPPDNRCHASKYSIGTEEPISSLQSADVGVPVGYLQSLNEIEAEELSGPFGDRVVRSISVAM